MTSTYEFDLDTIKMNHHAKYLRQSSFHSKVGVGHTDRQTHIALDGHTESGHTCVSCVT